MDNLQFFVNLAVEHWCFIAATGILWAFGQIFKTVAPPPTTNRYWAFLWRLLPVQPVLAGLLLGMLPWAPIPATVKAVGGFASFLYYGAAGVMASYGHDIWTTFRKYKFVVPTGAEEDTKV